MSTNVPEDDSSAPVMLRPNLANLEQDSHQVNRKKKKVVAIGVKTSGETMHSFVPIQLLTFLKGREELLFLGGDDYDGDDGGPVALNRIQKKKELADEVYDGGKRGTKRGRKPGKVTDGFDDTTNLRRRKRSSLDSANTGASKDDESLIPDKVEDLDPHKNLPGLKLLAEKFPHADWFLIVSDKSYVLMENLERLLEDLDPEEPHYIGKQSVNYKGCGIDEFGHGPTMATDAGGILLSKGAIKPMLEIMDSCIVTYHSCWSGDIRVALCLRDAGIRIGLPQEGFTGDSPGTDQSAKQSNANAKDLTLDPQYHSFPALDKRNTADARNQTRNRHGFPQFAIALKTGGETVADRVPIQLMTFLADVENLVLIGDDVQGEIGNRQVVDVYSGLYEKTRERLGIIQGGGMTVGQKPQELPKQVQTTRAAANTVNSGRVTSGQDLKTDGWKKDAHKNLPGFRVLYESYPDASLVHHD
ncbi:hypothetical protein BDR26DRAFT_936344 [Obelidium mucronatum]|nr:hypothetical protein BDR26DRAFT_936344 [Obelidium mucronatum]